MKTSQARSAGRWTLASVLGLAALATLAVVLARPAHGNASSARGTVVTTAQRSLGRILVDARGRTLYLFEKDRKALSECNTACASYWPPLLTTGKPLAAAKVKATLLGTIKRSDGKVQVTYAGHPLYAFAPDSKPGQAKGQGVDAFGGGWYIVSASGAKIDKQPVASSSGNAPAAPGYGY